MSTHAPPQPQSAGTYHSGEVRLKRFTGFLCAATSVIAYIVQIGPRDRYQWLAPVFYATPTPVILGVAILGWLLVRRDPSRTVRWALAIVALVQLVPLKDQWRTATSTEAPIKLGFWNIASGGMGWDEITSDIKSWDADIVGLAESGLHFRTDDPLARRRYWLERFEGYNVVRFPRGMRLITKYPAKEIDHGRIGDRSYYGLAEVEIDGRGVYVVMADLLSGPTLPRKPSFTSLRGILKEVHSFGKPVILMGDMNTPTESVHFDRCLLYTSPSPRD